MSLVHSFSRPSHSPPWGWTTFYSRTRCPDGYLGCSDLSAVVHGAALNIDAPVFVSTCFHFSWAGLRSAIAGSYRGGPQKNRIYLKLCIYSYMFKLHSPSKYSPFDATHPLRLFSTAQNRVWWFFLRFYLFHFQTEGTGGRETSMCGCLSRAPTGGLACNPGVCPDWESNQ